jgi:hypothetical protein
MKQTPLIPNSTKVVARMITSRKPAPPPEKTKILNFFLLKNFYRYRKLLLSHFLRGPKTLAECKGDIFGSEPT